MSKPDSASAILDSRWREGDVYGYPAHSPLAPECPYCTTRLVPKHRGRDGRMFWGCPRWPACTGTRDAVAAGDRNIIYRSCWYRTGKWIRWARIAEFFSDQQGFRRVFTLELADGSKLRAFSDGGVATAVPWVPERGDLVSVGGEPHIVRDVRIAEGVCADNYLGPDTSWVPHVRVIVSKPQSESYDFVYLDSARLAPWEPRSPLFHNGAPAVHAEWGTPWVPFTCHGHKVACGVGDSVKNWIDNDDDDDDQIGADDDWIGDDDDDDTSPKPEEKKEIQMEQQKPARTRKTLKEQGGLLAGAMLDGVAMAAVDKSNDQLLKLLKRLAERSPAVASLIGDPIGAELAKGALAFALHTGAANGLTPAPDVLEVLSRHQIRYSTAKLGSLVLTELGDGLTELIAIGQTLKDLESRALPEGSATADPLGEDEERAAASVRRPPSRTGGA